METIRKVGEGKIEIDAPKVVTVKYDKTSLLRRRADRQSQIDEIDALLAKIEQVKNDGVNTEAISIEDVIN